jgi:transposase InsO family protein
MNSHKNARLTRLGRVHLMQQIARIGLEAAADQVGISKRRAYIWHKRWNEWGEAGLCDRSSRPASSPRQIKPDKRERVIQLRCNHRLIYTQIALRVGLSVATVGRICNQADIAKLPPIQMPPPKRRYERQIPGEILHMDMKKLARFERPGHRVTGNFNQFSRAPGYHALHVAIDDHSRVGFSKILPDQTIQNVITFTLEALRYYRAMRVKVTGIMTDNGSAYRSKKFAKLLRRLKIRHLRTRPYTPRTNGKAERFIQTLLREWAYAYCYPNSDARTLELPFWIEHYNFYRPHSAINHQPPASRLGFKMNNVMRNYT